MGKMKRAIMVCLLMHLVIVFSACNKSEMYNYYSTKANYVSANGTVRYISFDEDTSSFYLDFSDLTPTFDDSCFKIVGENVTIVLENGIESKIAVGDQVEFVTAPRYFGDGYVMPIVSLTVDGEVLLDFDEGYENLMEWLG